MNKKLSLVLCIDMLNIKDLYKLDHATSINKDLNSFLLSFYNKHDLLSKIDEKSNFFVNWCLRRSNRRFIMIKTSTFTKHTTKNNIETMEVMNDNIVFNMFFEGLNNNVIYEIDVTYKNKVLKIGNSIFNYSTIDRIYKDLPTDKETLNICRIHFPIINGKRHLQFLSGDEKIFIVDISNFINLIRKNLIDFKKIIDKIMKDGRPDLLD